MNKVPVHTRPRRGLFDPTVKLVKVDGKYAMTNVYPNLSQHTFSDEDKIELIRIILQSATTTKCFVRLNAGILAKRYKMNTQDIQLWMRYYKKQEAKAKRKSSENLFFKAYLTSHHSTFRLILSFVIYLRTHRIPFIWQTYLSII